jgi:hypothetical protein
VHEDYGHRFRCCHQFPQVAPAMRGLYRRDLRAKFEGSPEGKAAALLQAVNSYVHRLWKVRRRREIFSAPTGPNSVASEGSRRRRASSCSLLYGCPTPSRRLCPNPPPDAQRESSGCARGRPPAEIDHHRVVVDLPETGTTAVPPTWVDPLCVQTGALHSTRKGEPEPKLVNFRCAFDPHR